MICSIAIVSSYILFIPSLHEWFECYTDEVEYSLIQELMLYMFELGHDAIVTKLANVDKDDMKAPFLIFTTPRWRKGTTPFTGLQHLPLIHTL